VTGGVDAVRMQQRFKFPIAVAATSLALVSVIVVVGLVSLPIAAAAAPGWVAGAAFGHNADGLNLPPELQGLGDLPPNERFAHFTGVQVSLKDKDNRPLTVRVTPGIAGVSTPTSLTLAANDGTSKTFTLNDQTTARGSHAPGDQVVVVTFNDETTARALIEPGKGGFSHGGGPNGWHGWGR
jgi:hypothetical protein